jgi:hypothetical protein
MDHAPPPVVSVFTIHVPIKSAEKAGFLKTTLSSEQWIKRAIETFPFLEEHLQALDLQKFTRTIHESVEKQSFLSVPESFLLALTHTKEITPSTRFAECIATPLRPEQIEALRTGLAHPTIILDPLTATILNDVVTAYRPKMLPRQISALKPWVNAMFEEWFLSTELAAKTGPNQKEYNNLVKTEVTQVLDYNGTDPDLLNQKNILRLFFWKGYQDSRFKDALTITKKIRSRNIKDKRKEKYKILIVRKALENLGGLNQETPVKLTDLFVEYRRLWEQDPKQEFPTPINQGAFGRFIAKLDPPFQSEHVGNHIMVYYDTNCLDQDQKPVRTPKTIDQNPLPPPPPPPAAIAPPSAPKIPITVSVQRFCFTPIFYDMTTKSLRKTLLANGITTQPLPSITNSKDRNRLKNYATPIEAAFLTAFWDMAFPNQEPQNTAGELLDTLTETRKVISKSPDGFAAIPNSPALIPKEKPLFDLIAALTKPGCFSKPDIVKLFLGEEATEDASTALINFLTEQKWIAPVTLEKKVMAQAQPAANASGEFGSLSWVVVPDGKATFGRNPLNGAQEQTTAEPPPIPHSLTR